MRRVNSYIAKFLIPFSFICCEKISDDSAATGENGMDSEDNIENIQDNSPLKSIECAPNEILYTTKYGLVIELGSKDGFGGNLVYNTYEDGIGRLTFGNDVLVIPDNAFKGCNSIEHIKYPEAVTTIGKNAFEGCTSLTYAPIQDAITYIMTNAFKGCSGLEYLVIPENVVHIGAYAFENCSGLKQTRIESSILREYGYQVFKECPGSIYINQNMFDYTSSNYKSYGFFYGNKFTKLVFGPNVTKISDYNFAQSSELTELFIPDTIKEIGTGAFYNCPNLKTISVGTGVETINSSAFKNCASLESVELHEGLVTIEQSAFRECACLTSIMIPSTVTHIGEYAFGGCKELKIISLPSTLTYISEGLLYGCTSLEEFEIHENISEICTYAFALCTSLQSITIPSTVKTLGNFILWGCTCETRICCNIPEGTKRQSANYRDWIFSGPFVGIKSKNVIIAEGVKTIGMYAFAECEYIENITISDSVQYIGGAAFYKCTGLKTLNIGKGIRDIGFDAFTHCTGELYINSHIRNPILGDTPFGSSYFHKVTLGKDVTSVGEKAFSGNIRLKNVYSLSEIPPIGNNEMFPASVKIYVPKGAGESYRTAKYWSNYANEIYEM